MHNIGLKKMFEEAAKSHGFESAFGGWFKESNECILVLDLQKSNFGDYFDLNIKIFIQGMFDNIYSKNKNLVKIETGDVFRRHPPGYKTLFDYDNSFNDDERKKKMEELFKDFILPFSEKALNKSGIIELAEMGEIYLLPAVKKRLGV